MHHKFRARALLVEERANEGFCVTLVEAAARESGTVKERSVTRVNLGISDLYFRAQSAFGSTTAEEHNCTSQKPQQRDSQVVVSTAEL